MVNSCAVEAEGLRVVRGARTVLHDLDLVVPAGVITGLLGPSGSGKSTLMRAIVGAQRISRGSLTVLGRPAGSAELRSLIGYSTQAPSVYLDLTVEENLRYFAAVRCCTDRAEVARVLGLVGLTKHARRSAGTLSGGELGRASLAVTLLAGSRLLILDEPTVGLDPVLRNELWTLFRDLAGEGVSMLVSSHVMDEAERCDQLLLMREGAILAQDTPAALRARTGAEDVEEAFVRITETDQSSTQGSRQGAAR
ncbi:ABC transporter ATP-binding protein [Kineococcus arenarius]|uniref:ABC transporter ATP-binding protein n=1 Tax=unclassified Kineococcus TaxID=2621656 RepID=UPI003D7E48B7